PPPDQAIAEAFRRDARALPACLVYRNHAGDPVGYMLMEVAQQLRKGVNPLSLFAGLADAPDVRGGCRDGRQPACAFYLSGVALQSYLAASALDGAGGKPPAGRDLARATLVRYVAKLTEDNKPDLLTRINDWARK